MTIALFEDFNLICHYLSLMSIAECFGDLDVEGGARANRRLWTELYCTFFSAISERGMDADSY